MKTLCIIPARGGSKGIPRKNIKLFLGKPLLAWSIETAIRSGVADRTIVSTDDEEIAAIAKKYGAEVPFLRPADLAMDSTPTLSVLQHAVHWLKENQGYSPDMVVLLEPTAPGRQPEHLQEAMQKLFAAGTDSVISIMESPHHHNPHWKLSMDDSGTLRFFTGESLKEGITRRQNLPKVYMRNGCFYIFKTELLFGKEPNFYGEKVAGYLMDSSYFFDIDTPEDWKIAEEKMQKLFPE